MKRTILILLTLFSFLALAEAPKTFEQLQAECTGAGKEWNSELNRCTYTQQTHETQQAHLECEQSADPDACYENLASEQTGVSKGEGRDGGKSSTMGAAISSAYSAFLLVSGMAAKNPGGKKWCISKMIFMGSSAAWLAGDLILKSSAKKRFKQLAAQFQSEAGNQELKGAINSSFESQLRAFHYLRSEQEIVKSNAEQRTNLHGMAALGFGAALGMAIFETIMMNKPGGRAMACTGSGKKSSKPKPKAKGLKGLKGINFSLGSSPQIAVGAGVMLGWNAKLMSAAAKEKKTAAHNIQQIEEVMESFEVSMAGFCPDGREDLNNARCYCYNTDGSNNPNRTNSAMCQNLWASDQQNYFVPANDYLGPAAPPMGCMTVVGQYDESCQCKKMINTKTGENACLKVSSNSFNMGTLGQNLALPQAASNITSFGNGANHALGSLNSASLAQQAARINKTNSALIGKAQKEGHKFPSIVPNAASLADKLAPKLAAYAKKKHSPSSLDSAFPGLLASRSRPKEVELAKGIDQVKKRISPGLKLKGGVGLKLVKGKNANNFQYNWNEANGEDGGKTIDLGVEEANYKYDANDIIKDDEESLFQVITRRYNSSGLKRLFGGGGQ